MLGGVFLLWGIGLVQRLEFPLAFHILVLLGQNETDKVVPQQTSCWCCNNIPPLSLDPIVQRCSSSFVISGLVARWRGSGELGGRGDVLKRAEGGGELVVSL